MRTRKETSPATPDDNAKKAVATAVRQRRRDRRKRAKNPTPPTEKRVRCWQRRRDWDKHQDKRREAWNTGTLARTLLAQQESHAARNKKQLYPYYVPEVLRQTRSAIALSIVGWVAFAWVLHGHSQLVGSYAELALLVNCHPKSVERWMNRLRARGWISADYHFGKDENAVTWQLCNSYAAGPALRRLLGGGPPVAKRPNRANFFVPEKQDPQKIGSVVSLPKKEKTSDRAHERAEAVSPAATPGIRPPRAASQVDAPIAAATPASTPDELSRVEVGEGSGTCVESDAGAPGAVAAPRSETTLHTPPSAPQRPAEASPSRGSSPASSAEEEERRPPPRYPGRKVVEQAGIREVIERGDGGNPKAWFALMRKLGVVDPEDT